MIRLIDGSLTAPHARRLEEWQSAIDALPSYSDRVKQAKASFSTRNKKTNRTFNEVKRALTTMCSGARRCVYCEDSCADEVEHFRPKNLYPEVVFAWSNYLYACGTCNSPKGNKFEVFADANGERKNVKRGEDDPIVPPIAGRPLLINPRYEDPFSFMDLDVQDTFNFVERDDTPEILERASYTIEVLDLNRDLLLEAREEAFDSYRARLVEYNHKKATGSPQSRLDALSAALKRMQHPTVWREMQRQHALLPELSPLFQASPEALSW